MTRYHGRLTEHMRQIRKMYYMVMEYEAYARSIGVMVDGDELTCATEEQAKLLDAKWRELTEACK